MGFSKFGNEGGSGGHFGEGGGFTPFEGKPGPPSFGGDSGYCNLQVSLAIIVRHGVTQVPTPVGSVPISLTTMEMILLVMTNCEEESQKEEATVVVGKKKIGSQDETSGSHKPENHKELCKAFDGIEDTELIDPSDLPGLFKNLSNSTNEIPGDFSLGDFMSEACSNRTGGAGENSVLLVCSKNVGLCDKRESDSRATVPQGWTQPTRKKCGKFLKIMLDFPEGFWQPAGENDLPWDDVIGGREAVVDPCKLAALLKCWKEHPNASTSIPIINLGQLGGLLSVDPLPQGNIDEAAAKLTSVLQSKCTASAQTHPK